MLKYISGAGFLICLTIILIDCPSFAFEDQNFDGIIVRLGPPPGREFIMKPDSTWVERCTGYPLRDLMAHPDDWPVTRDVIDYFGYASWILYDNFSDSELNSYFSQLNAWDLNFVLGVMAIKNLPYARTGEQCYAIESARWIRYDSLGLTISALGIDEPLTAAVAGHLGATEFPPISDLEYAVRETADWLELTRADPIIGDLPISLTEAYPRTTYPGTSKEAIIEFIDCLQEECDDRGIVGISDLVIDYNWCGYSQAHYWYEVIDLENYANSIGLPFAMLFWPARSYTPAHTDEDFLIDIMYQGDLYFNTYGGSPDIIDVTAWDYIPVQMVPESFGTSAPLNVYPFTWSFLKFYNTYYTNADGNTTNPSSQIIDIPSITSLSPNPARSGVTVQFHSPDFSTSVLFEAFDVTGRKVRTEDIGAVCPGDNIYSWDGCTSSGEPVSSGIYFVQMTLDGLASNISRLIVVKE